MTISHWLQGVQVLNLLQNKSRCVVHYDDKSVVTWYNNMVELILELEEAMGSNDREDFDYDSNLDT